MNEDDFPIGNGDMFPFSKEASGSMVAFREGLELSTASTTPKVCCLFFLGGGVEYHHHFFQKIIHKSF